MDDILSLNTLEDDDSAIGPLITRATKAEREAAKKLTRESARFHVDLYYQTQRNRIAAAAQIRAATEAGEDTGALLPLFNDQYAVEKKIGTQLGLWAEASLLGRWAMSICGIGPVIAAGLLAHIDIKKASSASSIWRFAGLDPTLEWGKKQKRPFNAKLKTLCAFKIGESFVKQQARPQDFYGHIFGFKKRALQEQNAAGELAPRATAALAAKNYSKATVARSSYETGALPPAHVHADARRRAVKLFLAHYFAVGYEIEYGTPPPLPYAIAHMNHVHRIPPPNWPMAGESVLAIRAEIPRVFDRAKDTEMPTSCERARAVEMPKAHERASTDEMPNALARAMNGRDPQRNRASQLKRDPQYPRAKGKIS